MRLIKTEKDGVEFYTDSHTGESGMSISGLARFVGVTPTSISSLLDMLSQTSEDAVKAEVLKPWAEKEPFLKVPGLTNIKVVRDEVCAAVIEYYAFESKQPTKAAQWAFRKFAAKGLRGAIHEITGFKKSEVTRIPKKIADYYIAEEFQPWERRFPESFFKELYRLRGWDYSLRQENKPYVTGKYINNLVYARLPVGVLEALREANPVTDKGYRPHRYHQLLSQGQGTEHLDKQIVTVVALMKASDSWNHFMSMLNRATPLQVSEEELPLLSAQIQESV